MRPQDACGPIAPLFVRQPRVLWDRMNRLWQQVGTNTPILAVYFTSLRLMALSLTNGARNDHRHHRTRVGLSSIAARNGGRLTAGVNMVRTEGGDPFSSFNHSQ
jgi:hypothetical protein